MRSEFPAIYCEYSACTESLGSMGKQAYAAARKGACPPHLLNIWETHVLDPAIDQILALSNKALLTKAGNIDDVLKKLEILTRLYMGEEERSTREALESIRNDLESLFRAC